jgi:diguanylate cyclase (GGDEF)-like protein
MGRAGSTSIEHQSLRTAIAGLWERLFPPPPAELRTLLARDQYEAVQRHIPMLHWVAMLNMAIINLTFWQQGTPFRYWGWTGLIILFNIVRLIQWRRRPRTKVRDADIARFLRGTDIASTFSVTVCSLLSCLSFYQGWLIYPVLIPVSLAFGAFSIAHCLAPLRTASHAALIIGIIPSGILMILFGDFLALVLGVSATSVALLKLTFLRDHYRQTLDRLDMHRRVDELARTDPLTGLANRRAFHDAAERALSKARRGDGALAVALIDLDGFKPVNDALGHAAGDAVLCAVAQRLQAAAGRSTRIGRMGGDEFVVLFTDVTGDADLSARAAALLSALIIPIGFEGQRISVGASIGCARYPAQGSSVDALIRHADDALYAVKAANRERSTADAAAGVPGAAAA